MYELRLVYEAELKAFPPRLPEQPIFYPVLNFGYAEQIARDWNTKSQPFAGYVTRFEVDGDYAVRFERRVIGSCEHEDLWAPVEQLDDFNRHIVGLIEVDAAYFGPLFRGLVPERGHLEGRDAIAQIVLLARLLRVEGVDPRQVDETSHSAIFLHYPFWKRLSFSDEGVTDDECERVLERIGVAWLNILPEIPLTISCV